MYDVEKQLCVYELKGLLEGLGKNADHANYNLAVDNVQGLIKKASHMRNIIDRIEEDELF